MTKYQSLAIIALSAVASLFLAGEASANLSNRLLASNFNLYSSPSPAGNMVLQDLKGKTFSLAGMKGKVVILNFWRIDCPPCSIEKPILQRVYKELADRGLEIIAVNLFDRPEKLRTFVQRNGFSFTFAFDGANRFSVRQQKVGSGPSTTFVVNSRSEAIYEIPGVPTTYVINRNGQVVGSSVGLINWEEEPFQELLESLLGPQKETLAQNPAFTEPAREGARAQFVSAEDSEQNARGLLAQQSLDDAEAQPALPFQGPSRGPVAAPTIQPQPPVPVEQPTGGDPPITAPQPAKKPLPAAQTKKKPVQQAGQADARKPKPYKPATPASTRITQPTGITPGASGPSTAGPMTPAPAAAVGGAQGELPPLPPAMPYSPNTASPRQASPMVPDEYGRVTARIPESGRGQASYPSQGPSASLPPAEPLSSRNPIDGFILESFKSSGGQAQRPVPVQPPGADKPASSVIDQVGRDVMQLGSGIKDTFSRIIPGGR